MSRVAPPRPPAVGFTGSDGLSRVRLRFWQILMAAITLVLSGWFVTMGPIPAIIALFITKHVLVAILVVGLHADSGPRRTTP